MLKSCSAQVRLKFIHLMNVNIPTIIAMKTKHICEQERSVQKHYPGLEVIKHFSCSSQLSLKFILLINVKMPTIVGVLTFISSINLWLL